MLIHLDKNIKSQDELTLVSGVTQYSPKTGEFLSDPSGQIPLYLCRTADGWHAATARSRIPASATTEVSPVGYALHIILGDSNGYITPFKNVHAIPAGMRARIENDKVCIIRDDLKAYLKEQHPSEWMNSYLTGALNSASTAYLLFSGGLDSVVALISNESRPNSDILIRPVHIRRPGFTYEYEACKKVVDNLMLRESKKAFNSAHSPQNLKDRFIVTDPSVLTADTLLTNKEFSPFGRRLNYLLYRQALQTLPPATHILNGELNMLDVGFTDFSDRFRGVRRRLYNEPLLRYSFFGFAPVVRTLTKLFPRLLVQKSLANYSPGRRRFATLLRSAQTSISRASFMFGSVSGPKGFPGFTTCPYIQNEEYFLEDLDNKLSTILGVEPDCSFDLDFFLFRYRWYLGKSNCSALLEVCDELGAHPIFPFNSLEALAFQAHLPWREQIDKQPLKDFYSSAFPKLSDILNFNKNLSLGHEERSQYVDESSFETVFQSVADLNLNLDYIDQTKFSSYMKNSIFREHKIGITSLLTATHSL